MKVVTAIHRLTSRIPWLSSTAVFFLVMGPLSAEAAAPLSSATPILEEMGKKLEDRGRPVKDRLEIIQAFEGWATPQVRGPLVAVLQDPAADIRKAAAQALGWPGNDEAVSALRQRIEAPDEATVVKAAAVRSLGRIGDRSVRPLVVARVRDPQPQIREAALWGLSLGSLTDPSDRVSYLLELAEERNAEAQMRSEAIRALAEAKEDRVIERLAKLLEHEPRLTVALPAGEPRGDQIMTLRYAQARDVPAWSAAALGKLEARGTLPLILKTAEDPNDFFLRLMSVQVLIAWKAPEAAPVFVRRLEDPLADIRVLAVAGLARLGDVQATAPIAGRLSDPSSAVRAQAVTALAMLGDPKVRPALEALQQKESDSEVRSALEEALSKLPR